MLPTRSFYSPHQIKKVSDREYFWGHNAEKHRPRAYWYNYKDEWIQWYLDTFESPDISYEDVKIGCDRVKKTTKPFLYVYEIIFKDSIFTDLQHKDRTKILQIDTVDKFDQFVMEYSVPEIDKDVVNMYVDYGRIKKDYAGVEIIPYREDRVTYFYSKPKKPIKELTQHYRKTSDKNVQKILKHFGINTQDVKKYHESWYMGWNLVPGGAIWNLKDTIKTLKAKCHLYTHIS